MKTNMTQKQKTLTLVGLVLFLLLYLSASSVEYNDYLYENIPDSTLNEIYDILEVQGIPATKEAILFEYKSLKKSMK